MSATESFLDTSVLLYLLSSESDKADRTEQVLQRKCVISVQVLNEFAAVALRKLKLPIDDILEILGTIRAICRVEALTAEDHDRAIEIVERYGFSFYDSVIVASALRAGCKTLYSEDLQHGQSVEDRLTVLNPFRSV